eukprot:TRINITY_DN23682_c0_g1_i1.p1 TRINITY_DN23682_c0_g1~~TRINITY_DN23682_c0_g1_i1.p1  ORF type:complete len:451 (-),score=50.29 TRINITY_DN23682_c0_g1_i1:63-1415(-)
MLPFYKTCLCASILACSFGLGTSYDLSRAGINATSGNHYAQKRSSRCFHSSKKFSRCCCGEPDLDLCWSRGRNFIRCCSGQLHRCEGKRRPQLHVIAFGQMSEVTAMLSNSVIHFLGTPLLHFGQHRDHEPLPFVGEADGWGRGGAVHLIRKLLLTREVLDVLPPEDFVVYLDATDTLVQRWSKGDVLMAYRTLVERIAKERGISYSDGWEPVVFAGQQHCHPFETWASINVQNAEQGNLSRETDWNTGFTSKVYGKTGMGVRMEGGREVCSRITADMQPGSDTLPFLDSGAWMGRVLSARRLFGIVAGVANSERAVHCMEALKVTQAWYPELIVIDTETELFWTTELQLGAEDGYVHDEHPAVTMVKETTERTLCVLWTYNTEEAPQNGYWHRVTHMPPPLRTTGNTPFFLHFAGPSKSNVGRLCMAAYLGQFIKTQDEKEWDLPWAVL